MLLQHKKEDGGASIPAVIHQNEGRTGNKIQTLTAILSILTPGTCSNFEEWGVFLFFFIGRFLFCGYFKLKYQRGEERDAHNMKMAYRGPANTNNTLNRNIVLLQKEHQTEVGDQTSSSDSTTKAACFLNRCFD